MVSRRSLAAALAVLFISLPAMASVSFYPMAEVPGGLPEMRTDPVQVTITPSRPLGQFPRVYSDLSQGAETGDPMFYIQMSDLLGKMGARLVRCDPFSDTTKITVEDGLVHIDFSAADRIMDALQRAGAKPVWNIASFPDAMLDDSKKPDPALLDQFVYQVTHHWNVVQKRGVEYFEYDNEPPALDGPRFAVAVKAAHRADPTVKVGGPAVMGCPLEVLEQAVKYCDDNDVEMGFISFHLYYEMPEGFLGHIEGVERMLQKYPRFRNLEILLTEWGVDAGLNGSCDTLYNAAYYSSILEAVMHKWPRVRPMHFQFRDGWDPHGPSRDLWGRWGMVTYPNLLPKAVYNAGLMWSKMAETQVEAKTSDPSVRALAAIDENRVTILAWSWPHDYRALMDKAINHPRSLVDTVVNLSLEDIPFKSGGIRYTRYVVDQTHSNVLFDISTADLQAAHNLIFSRSGREVFEEKKLIDEGRFETTFTLPMHAVTLIELRPEERPPVNVVAHADRFNIWAGEKATITIQPRFDEHLELELLTDPANRSPWKLEKVSDNPLTITAQPPVADVKSMRYLNLWVRNKTSGAIGQTALEFQTDTPAFLARSPDHIDISPVTRQQQIPLQITNKTRAIRDLELRWGQLPEGITVTPASHSLKASPGDGTRAVTTVRVAHGVYPRRYHLTARLVYQGEVIHTLEVPVHLSLRSVRAKGPVTIDANLSDWEGVPRIRVASHEDFDGFLRKRWGGEEDLSATIQTQWDETNLYFAFQVRDDQHIQKVTTWQMKDFDSVHIGFDLRRDSTDPNVFFNEDDCDYVLGMLGTDDAHIYRHWGAQRSMGVPEGAKIAAHRVGDITTYEVAFNWESEFVPYARPEVGRVIGCSVYFLDYDEGQHPGEMRWGRGLYWHNMRPAFFNSIQLTE